MYTLSEPRFRWPIISRLEAVNLLVHVGVFRLQNLSFTTVRRSCYIRMYVSLMIQLNSD